MSFMLCCDLNQAPWHPSINGLLAATSPVPASCSPAQAGVAALHDLGRRWHRKAALPQDSLLAWPMLGARAWCGTLQLSAGTRAGQGRTQKKEENQSRK